MGQSLGEKKKSQSLGKRTYWSVRSTAMISCTLWYNKLQLLCIQRCLQEFTTHTVLPLHAFTAYDGGTYLSVALYASLSFSVCMVILKPSHVIGRTACGNVAVTNQSWVNQIGKLMRRLNFLKTSFKIFYKNIWLVLTPS